MGATYRLTERGTRLFLQDAREREATTRAHQRTTNSLITVMGLFKTARQFCLDSTFPLASHFHPTLSFSSLSPSPSLYLDRIRPTLST